MGLLWHWAAMPRPNQIRLTLALLAALALGACAQDKPLFPTGTALPPPSDEPQADPGEMLQP